MSKRDFFIRLGPSIVSLTLGICGLYQMQSSAVRETGTEGTGLREVRQFLVVILLIAGVSGIAAFLLSGRSRSKRVEETEV